MTHELVLKRFPMRYNVIDGIKVHGSDEDGGKDLCSLEISRQTAASLLTESHFQDEPIRYSSHISDNPFDAHTENPKKISVALFVMSHEKEI
jgi:hypothetical protein